MMKMRQRTAAMVAVRPFAYKIGQGRCALPVTWRAGIWQHACDRMTDQAGAWTLSSMA
jgi:hypothetical protein